MKKCMKFLALALAAVLTFSLAGNVKAAEKFEPGYTNLEELNAEIDYNLDAEVKAQLADIVKDSVASLDKADEADPAKSTFVAFRYSPLKVVKYDGEAHGMKANAYKTIGGAYVGKAEILYVGMTADGTVYNSFDKPVEVGFYYAVAMFAGNDNNYPSVGYGVLVIMPVCTCPDPECPVPECPNKPNVPDTPDVPGTPDCPHWPDCPDWPNCPDKPNTPDTPDTPDVPDTPDKPNTPDTPDVPDTPDTPDVPNTPDTPDEEPKAPVTGDSANFMVYVVMMAVAVVAMVAAKRNRA